MIASMSGPETVLVRVTGRVQGVGYRAWAADAARGLGLRGWVRNARDGSVSALLSGPSEAVAAMIAAMRDGPRHAAVAAVTSEPSPEMPPADFEIRR